MHDLIITDEIFMKPLEFNICHYSGNAHLDREPCLESLVFENIEAIGKKIGDPL
jgi:hypothetical protein